MWNTETRPTVAHAMLLSGTLHVGVRFLDVCRSTCISDGEMRMRNQRLEVRHGAGQSRGAVWLRSSTGCFEVARRRRDAALDSGLFSLGSGKRGALPIRAFARTRHSCICGSISSSPFTRSFRRRV